MSVEGGVMGSSSACRNRAPWMAQSRRRARYFQINL